MKKATNFHKLVAFLRFEAKLQHLMPSASARCGFALQTRLCVGQVERLNLLT